MPRFGTLDVKRRAETFASEIDGYKTESWLLKGAQILTLAYEIDDVSADALIPPAMHPTIPAYAALNVMVSPESPAGRFAIAEVRVVGRAGFRPRSFVLASVIDGDKGRRELTSRWGFPAIAGEINLDLRHDRVRAVVRSKDKTVLECELLDRDTISGADIQYIASMHLAKNRQDGKQVLVQVDPEYVFSKAERGKPSLISCDTNFWGANGQLQIGNPIAATFAVCDVTLPK